MMGMAAAIGQFSGGALIQWNPAGLGWRAIFLLTLPVCAGHPDAGLEGRAGDRRRRLCASTWAARR